MIFKKKFESDFKPDYKICNECGHLFKHSGQVVTGCCYDINYCSEHHKPYDEFRDDHFNGTSKRYFKKFEVDAKGKIINKQ